MICKHWFLILLVIITFTLGACNDSSKTHYVYFDNGAVKRKFEETNGLYNGNLTDYYPNGSKESFSTVKDSALNGVAYTYFSDEKLKAKLFYKYNKLDGTCYYYYNNGNIQSIETYKDGLKKGPYTEFYSIDSGRIHHQVNYIVIKGESYANNVTTYDSSGTIIHKTGQIEISDMGKDAFLGQPYHLSLVLDNPEFPNMNLVLGKFDAGFNCLDLAKTDTLFAKDKHATIVFIPKKIGNDTLRGFVENFKTNSKLPNGAEGTVSRKIYFEYTYYVKPSSNSKTESH